ncbi:MAG TPA: FHA domain-containing protein [Verrucomicrobiae bacterium]|nr:FHA domain-containing protein [Verrucomicrobiae bacterium]
MAKLVVLSEGFTGLTYELKVEKTTVGRVEDNAFQIAEQSVSSHHCELLQRSSDILVKDLNSTNGTFINGEQIKEAVLKPGQILRLGQVEMRLESGTAAAPAASPGKKPLDKTVVLPQGVKVGDFDAAGRGLSPGSTAFSKKSNKANKVFMWIAIGFGVLIVVAIIIAFLTLNR